MQKWRRVGGEVLAPHPAAAVRPLFARKLFMSHIWSGVFPAVTTQFHADETLDLASTAQHIAWQLECGVDGIIMCGSLGEASTLQAAEKIDLLKTAIPSVLHPVLKMLERRIASG